ncbi:glycosyltransferase family 2 protein [Methylomonas koyamae]|uniref:glycosyltransferase family 2 protein n=1 Tax=Methylomonas koyamae TaxID=702114 RepID=UPI00112E8991|nr:glycosyltransferase family 2 protein [Methylomonas koyamae]TPQ25502.1 hypothetical protein C2U68_15465 [Methylomonas koyamae]
MNRLFIVITDFNGFAQTRRCLDALYKSTYKDFTVLVVDHGTTEETRTGLQNDYPCVIRLPGPSSLWWAGANNLGIRFAMDKGADLIMLLNNDCYVTPETIQQLVDNLRNKSGAIIAPIQRDWPTGGIISINPRHNFLLGFPTIGGLKSPVGAGLGEVISVDLIIGGRGVIIPKHIFSKIGLFNETQLPHYGADHDFYIRVKKKFALYVSLNAYVDVDPAQTSLAANICEIGFETFIRTLIDRRSHRNIYDISVLFKLHYPLPRFYLTGVVFYYIRYFCVYFVNRYILVR